MDARNFTFMFYGFAAAWVIVLAYLIILARRGARLKRELEDVKHLLDTSRSDSSIESEQKLHR